MCAWGGWGAVRAQCIFGKQPTGNPRCQRRVGGCRGPRGVVLMRRLWVPTLSERNEFSVRRLMLRRGNRKGKHAATLGHRDHDDCLTWNCFQSLFGRVCRPWEAAGSCGDSACRLLSLSPARGPRPQTSGSELCVPAVLSRATVGFFSCPPSWHMALRSLTSQFS